MFLLLGGLFFRGSAATMPWGDGKLIARNVKGGTNGFFDRKGKGKGKDNGKGGGKDGGWGKADGWGESSWGNSSSSNNCPCQGSWAYSQMGP